ncbi:MAG: tetrathionate reductase family octaheme c-type cytochrome [Rhodobiaceae bacterium]|nr:tetrathionate reductase family octaheme c-type cytochrome [Rhodobiaceae bacterium]MCC0054416.1 tetrathionate reductase family octaheme c-type cytochrome [Rhodobiaceae bacterium]
MFEKAKLFGGRKAFGAIALAFCALAAVTAGLVGIAGAQDVSGNAAAQPASTANHELFEALKRRFESGPEVTAACLSCHTEASKQVMSSIHWTWSYEHPVTGQKLGKSEVINSFCGNVASNEPRCTSCHAGYGWTDMKAGPPKDPSAVDCLICHDQTGKYSKIATAAGHVAVGEVSAKAKTITGASAEPVDLSKAAMSVGLPGRENCGQCHFYGGGGDNVKHGDLSSALFDPSRHVDVHMAGDGANMTCSACHVSESHHWAGSRYNVNAAGDETSRGHGMQRKPGERRDVASCESCHGATPHPATSVVGIKLNDHTDRVACQTCHIPEFAKGGIATKTKWDWSTAGKLRDGKPYGEEGYTQGDGRELHTYLSTKGDFAWGEDVTPYYAWFAGQVIYTKAEDTIDPAAVVEVNRIPGSPDDPNARIWPFKRMVGRQAYDSKLNRLVMSNVFGPDTDTAFWTNFDWAKAIAAGMKAAGKEYSGEFGFVDTYMYWPITHMVAPREEALKCDSCHAPQGRLAGLGGFYMPGRGDWGIADKLGIAMLLAAIAGVLGHAALRLFSKRGS